MRGPAVPAGWGRLRNTAAVACAWLRQIGDQLIAGLEEFLFVDDVVAVKMARVLWPVRSMATTALGDLLAADRGCGRRCGGNRWRKRVGTAGRLTRR